MKRIVSVVSDQSLCYMWQLYLQYKAVPNLQQLVGVILLGQALRKELAEGEG